MGVHLLPSPSPLAGGLLSKLMTDDPPDSQSRNDGSRVPIVPPLNTTGALKRGVQLLQGPAREALPRLADPDGLGNEERKKIVKCFAV